MKVLRKFLFFLFFFGINQADSNLLVREMGKLKLRIACISVIVKRMKNLVLG